MPLYVPNTDKICAKLNYLRWKNQKTLKSAISWWSTATGGVWSRQHTKKAVSKRLGKKAGVSQLRASRSAHTSGKHSSRAHISKNVSSFGPFNSEGTTKVLPKRVAPSRRRHSSTPHSSHVSRTAPIRSDSRRSSASESLFCSKTLSFPKVKKLNSPSACRKLRIGNRLDSQVLHVAYHCVRQGPIHLLLLF